MDLDENFNYGNDEREAEQQERDALKQELRKSLLIEVGKIIEYEKNNEIGSFETLDDEKLEVDKSVVHALTECLFQHAGTMTKDMFAFARHAKRVNINQDDVKLLFRRREDLLKEIEKFEKKVVKKKKSKVNNNTPTTTTTTTRSKNGGGGNNSNNNNNMMMYNNNIDDDDDDELFY